MKKLKSIIFCLFQILVCSALTVFAQNAEKKSAEMLLPVIPLIADYQYTPVYVSQDIEGHPQYKEIMAIFNPEDASSVEVVLIEKDSHKRVYYCNSENNQTKRKMQGYEAFLAKIDFKISESDKQLPIYGFGFQDKKGQPVLWRVIPTGKPSIRGAGINRVTDNSAFRIEYRDLGTTVGEGTAVKIGEKVFEAQPWAATSAPPYFYAYHGSFTIGRHLGAMRLGDEKWSVSSQPKSLKKGESWILTDGRGYKRTLKIVSDKNNELVIDEEKFSPANASRLRIVIHVTPTGYNLRAVEMNDNSKEMRIKFEPELPVQTSDAKDFEGAFLINQGEKNSVLTGTITRKQMSDNSVSFKWQPKSPDWTKSKVLESLINIQSDGFAIQVK